MGTIFTINEELASIAVTSTELLSSTRTIARFIKAKEFIQHFSAIILEINKSYSVIDESFAPFVALQSEQDFAEKFDERYKHFKDNYLLDISKPRKYCDNVYDAYIEMQQAKEAKTKFPLIKQSFIRLDELYDKWINNDIYLAMSIDRVLKLENKLLSEIATQKEIDVEDAFIICQIAFNDFSDYLQITKQNSEKIRQLFN